MAGDGMEHLKVVEFYPNKIIRRGAEVRRDVTPGHCIFRIAGEGLTRTIYRPRSGPDMLMSQSMDDETRYLFSPREFPIAEAYDRSNLFNCLLRLEPPVRTEEMRTWDPLNWSWTHVANRAAQYAQEQDLLGDQVFEIGATEVFCTIRVMHESSQWNHFAPRLPLENQACCICIFCQEDLDPDSNNNMAFYCQHVFHKPCLLNAMWYYPDNVCPICKRETLY